MALFRYRLEHFLVLITFLTSLKEPFATTSVLWETVAIWVSGHGWQQVTSLIRNSPIIRFPWSWTFLIRRPLLIQVFPSMWSLQILRPENQTISRLTMSLSKWKPFVQVPPYLWFLKLSSTRVNATWMVVCLIVSLLILWKIWALINSL